MANTHQWQRRSDEWVKMMEASARKKRARILRRQQALRNLRERHTP